MNPKLFTGLIHIIIFTVQIGCAEETIIIPPAVSNETGTSTDNGDKGTNTPTVNITEGCPDIGIESGELTTRYTKKTITLQGSDKTYLLHANWWNQWDGQTVSYDGLSFSVSNPKDLDVGPSVGTPLGYPSLYIGSYDDRSTIGSNLPKKVTDIQSIPTSFHTNAGSVGYANKNAAYDVWFTSDSKVLPEEQYDPGQGGAYLMVWLYKPDDRQPRGSIYASNQKIEGVEGEWNVSGSTPRIRPASPMSPQRNGTVWILISTPLFRTPSQMNSVLLRKCT